MTSSEIEKNRKDFSFFPENRWNQAAFWETYRGFFSQGLDFWKSRNYTLPPQVTYQVLLGIVLIEVLLSGVLSGKFNFIGLVFGQLGIFIGACISFGFILLMKEWLEARGNFQEYLVFYTYARFIALPFSLFVGVSPRLGGFLGLCVSLWITYAFSRTFSLKLSRFFILVAIVWGIGILGFLAAFFAGMKLFQ